MASSPPQYQYSEEVYLNDAIIRLSWRTYDVLPAWGKDFQNVQDQVSSSAHFLVAAAASTCELLERKISLNIRLREETEQNARWAIFNQMSGLRTGVSRQEVKVGSGAFTASYLLTSALQPLKDFDARLAVLLDEAQEVGKIVQVVSGRQLNAPVPDYVTHLLRDMSAYNESRRKTFWNLLEPNEAWKLDPGRSEIHKRLTSSPLVDYPQASVLWARFIAPQAEAIEKEARSLAVAVQLQRGKWQRIENNLNGVAQLLGGEGPGEMYSWYEEPFSLFSKTQLRLMKEIGALCEKR